MEELDSSLHSLNSSTSKQRYSFAQSSRFQQNYKPLCDSIYEIKPVMSKRATSFGYGNKISMVARSNFVPGVGKYEIQSDIDPQKNKDKSISFGVSREKMANLKQFLQKIPSPATYQIKAANSPKATTMKFRYVDHYFQKTINNPGPGKYTFEQLGSQNYYSSSKYRKVGISPIPRASRLEPLSNKNFTVGPTDYNPTDSFNQKGQYLFGSHINSNPCLFPKSQRLDITSKQKKLYPGPGQQYIYHNLSNSFSNFS